MFGFLKKKLSEGVKKLSKKAEARAKKEEHKKIVESPAPAAPDEVPTKVTAKRPVEKSAEPAIPEKKPTEEKKIGFLGKITKKELSEKDIDNFFDESETEFMQANVAVDVIDFLRKSLKEKLAGRSVKRGNASGFISQAFEESLLEAVNQSPVKLKSMASEARKSGKPLCIVFLGFNGSGKTTTIAKVARYMIDNGHKPVLAAADTFRAASIEQLEYHGEKLDVKVVKHNYGSDAAAVVFDAKKYAEANGRNIVLADTAGRMHTDKNLMDELKKVIRVNQPDLKILVVDSLTGNDAVQQAKKFNEVVGVDAVVMAKTDVNEKGGSILSVCYTIKKPILFLGTGQEYNDLEPFKPEKFVQSLLRNA